MKIYSVAEKFSDETITNYFSTREKALIFAQKEIQTHNDSVKHLNNLEKDNTRFDYKVVVPDTKWIGSGCELYIEEIILDRYV